MKRKNKKIVFTSKWDVRKTLKGARLKKLRQLWHEGLAWNASLEELGLKKSLTSI